MRSLHVVTSIDDEAAGPSYSVPALGRALGRNGVVTTLATVDKIQRDKSTGFEHKFFPSSGSIANLRRSPQLKSYLKSAMGDVKIVHNHSLWTLPNIYASSLAQSRSVPVVIAPRGTMHPKAWERSQWKKFPFWYLFQKRACQNASAFHATSEEEYEHIRRLGFKQPVIVLPNGIAFEEGDQHAHIDETPAKDFKEAVYFGRIHPIKGLERLLDAWHQLQSQDYTTGWRLRIVGHDTTGYGQILRDKASKLALKNVSFEGPLYGVDKFALMRRADVYILPSDSENFAMTVAEALSVATPVICSQGAPWQDLETYDCGWWPKINVPALTAAMHEAFAMTIKERAQMGMRGHELIKTHYAWDTIAAQMAECYVWIANGMDGSAPTYVRID